MAGVAVACRAAFQGLFSPDGAGSVTVDKQLEKFHDAVLHGSIEQITELLQEDALTTRTLLTTPFGREKNTACHIASSSTNMELLSTLHAVYARLNNGAGASGDILNNTNKRGKTCLHLACAAGATACMQFLLDHGADPLRVDKSGKTPLHDAVATGSAEVTRSLLHWVTQQAYAEDQPVAPASPPVQTMSSGTSAVSRFFRSQEASPQRSASASDVFQAQPLDKASLLVNGGDANGVTPLHIAAYNGRREITRLLLASGAGCMAQCSSDIYDSDMPCNAGWSPLHMAAMRGHLDVAVVILKHHAELPPSEKLCGWVPGPSSGGCVRANTDLRKLADKRGTTASQLASSRGYFELADLLDPSRPLSEATGGAGPRGADGRDLHPPAMFLCPITQELMADPVVACDGFTYERAALTKWLQSGKLTSPMTNLPLAHRMLYPNHVIGTAIKEWRAQHGLPLPSSSRGSAAQQARRRGHALRTTFTHHDDPFLNTVRIVRR